MQLVGECLLAKISALCVFCVMFISIVYLIISEICILICMSAGYFMCMEHYLSILCCSMDLD